MAARLALQDCAPRSEDFLSYRVKFGHRSNRTEAWSTGGSTATSTKSLPVDRPRPDKSLNSVKENASAPTITRSPQAKNRNSFADPGYTDVQRSPTISGPLAG